MASRHGQVRELSTFTLVASMVVIAAVLGVGGPLWVRGLVRQYESSAWPTADAKVTESDIRQGRYEHLRFRYEYKVDGRLHSTSNRRQAYVSLYYQFQSQREFVQGHLDGSHMTIHYDPSDPDVATMDPGLRVADFPAGLIVIAVLSYVALQRGCELVRRAGSTKTRDAV